MRFFSSRFPLFIILFTSYFLLTSCGAASMGAPATVSSQYMSHHLTSTLSSPQTIALLLPLRGTLGPVGQAIRQGFLAAAQQNTAPPQLHIIDTTAEPSIEAAYQKAITQNAQLIVGPLLRSQVQHIAGLTLKVPVITLNYLDPNLRPTPNLYQFGLSPRDEAQQAVQAAWKKGYRHALLLAVDTTWGAQLAQTFRNAWEQLGGIIVDQQSLSPHPRNLTSQIRHLLQFEAPNQRRTDFDVIFLASDKITAGQVKPLLKFFYAGDIPVYASASVYEATSTRQSNNDLNGLIFCAAPWMMGPPHTDIALYQQLKNTLPAFLFNRFRSYYALGVDAFKLTQYLATLQTSTLATLSGATGQLTLNEQKQIIRQLPCAQFQQGRLIAQ